jgi:hypothetical protein
VQLGDQVARLGLGHPAGSPGPGHAPHTAQIAELKRRHHVDPDVADRHRPARPDRVPRQPRVRGDAVQEVAQAVAVPAGDRQRRVTDADLGLEPGPLDQNVIGSGSRGHLHAALPHPRDIAEDAVAMPDTEVVVDHLHDLSAAVTGDQRASPHGADPHVVTQRRAGRGHPTNQQPGDGEQDHVQAPARPHAHGCRAAHHLRHGAGQADRDTHTANRSIATERATGAAPTVRGGSVRTPSDPAQVHPAEQDSRAQAEQGQAGDRLHSPDDLP